MTDFDNKVITEARRWLRTPFFHTGREIGVGVDCCGLIICVFNVVVGLDYDNRNYSPVAPNGLMRAELEMWCDEVIGSWEPGDVLLFNMAGAEQHVGFWTGSSLIHAYQSANCVAEHDLSPQWKRRVVGVYRFRQPCE